MMQTINIGFQPTLILDLKAKIMHIEALLFKIL